MTERTKGPAIAREVGTIRRQSTRWACVALLTLLLVGASAAPASAHARFFFGGVIGVPGYAYPYVAPYPYAYYPYAPGPAYAPYPAYVPYPRYGAPPPPGWVPGHWVWRHDRWGYRTRVWIPPHLR